MAPDSVVMPCLDCRVDTLAINEYYMVHDNVWLLAHPVDKGFLCIGCLEQRLKRTLTSCDFPHYPVNVITELFGLHKSERLLDRLTAHE